MVRYVHVLGRHEFRFGWAMQVAYFEVVFPRHLFPRFRCGHFGSHIFEVIWNRTWGLWNELYFAIPLDRVQFLIQIVIVISCEVLRYNFEGKPRHCLFVDYPIKIGVNVRYIQFLENLFLPLSLNLFKSFYTLNTVKKIDAPTCLRWLRLYRLLRSK